MKTETVNITSSDEREVLVRDVLEQLENAVTLELDELRRMGEPIINITPQKLLAPEQAGYLVDLCTGVLLCEP